MNNPVYPYNKQYANRYVFSSIGKKRIEKVVDFIPLGVKDLVNLCFGDLLPNGSIDDKSNSNNGDIARVLSTVVLISIVFLTEFPETTIFFTGSTSLRTRLYSRILRNHFLVLSKEFLITGIVVKDKDFEEISFDYKANQNYFAFLIKRIN